MRTANCPTEHELRALLSGQLPGCDFDRVAGHAETCLECAGRLHEFDVETPPIVKALRDADTLPLAPTAAAPALPGYEFHEVLGNGGMGVVYRATDVRLNRPVAVKFLRGVGAPELLARFRQEAEAVAQLRHPNIVQVFQVGEHAGAPFLVLELIEGGSLDRKLRGQPQPPRGAAAMVAQLAGAVAHAHTKGIVHRDLKPANVLLQADATPDSPYGTPRLTDFGIAKRLETGPALTTPGAIVGTPAYMAPEQARGGEVGPPADVYALGVILFEMLVGRPPFHTADVVDTLRQVCETEPVSPRRLNPVVPRDLETVCLKCLEKNPEGRYASAAALADDLDRFLSGRPVVARPVTGAVRAWKYARRHPAVSSLAVACVALFVTGFALVTWKWREAVANGKEAVDNHGRAERNFAEAERQRTAAVDSLAEAHQVQGFLADLIRASNPTLLADARGVTVRELLDAASDGIENRFEGRPAVEAAVRLAIGDSYLGLGDYVRARPHLERAAALRTELYGPSHRSTLIARSSLARAESRAGNLERAESAYREVLNALRASLGDDDPDTLTVGVALAGHYLTWQSRLKEAEPLLLEAVEGLRRQLGDRDATLRALTDLSTFHKLSGRFDEAERLLVEVTVAHRKNGNGAGALATETALATLYLDRRQYDRAERLLVPLTAALRERFGEDHIGALSSRSNLAAAWAGLGRRDEARAEMRQLITTCAARYGAAHPQTLTFQVNLASFELRAGNLAAAEDEFRTVLTARRRTTGPDDLSTLNVQLFLAKTCRLQKKFDDAEELLTDAVGKYSARFGDAHPATWNARRSAIDLYRQQVRRDRVEVVLRDLLAVARKAPDTPDTSAVLLYELGEAVLFQGRPADAEPILRECLKEPAAGLDGWIRGLTKSLLGDALTAQGKLDGAEGFLQEGYDGLLAARASIPPDRRARLLSQAALRLARYYKVRGNETEERRWTEVARAAGK